MAYSQDLETWLKEFKQNKYKVNGNPNPQNTGPITRGGITETNIGPKTKRPDRSNWKTIYGPQFLPGDPRPGDPINLDEITTSGEPYNQSQTNKGNTMGILGNSDDSYTMSGEDAYKNYFQSPNKRRYDLRRAAGMTLNEDYQDDNYFGNVGVMHYDNPEFEWGMNKPSFDLVKGGLDTLGGLTNTWMNYKKFGLLEDQSKYEMDMGNKKYVNDLILGNNQIANANFNIDERNAFKKAYGGEGGNYLMQDHLKTLG